MQMVFLLTSALSHSHSTDLQRSQRRLVFQHGRARSARGHVYKASLLSCVCVPTLSSHSQCLTEYLASASGHGVCRIRRVSHSTCEAVPTAATAFDNHMDSACCCSQRALQRVLTHYTAIEQGHRPLHGVPASPGVADETVMISMAAHVLAGPCEAACTIVAVGLFGRPGRTLPKARPRE
jgi:hypothetical protein